MLWQGARGGTKYNVCIYHDEHQLAIHKQTLYLVAATATSVKRSHERRTNPTAEFSLTIAPEARPFNVEKRPDLGLLLRLDVRVRGGRLRNFRRRRNLRCGGGCWLMMIVDFLPHFGGLDTVFIIQSMAGGRLDWDGLWRRTCGCLTCNDWRGWGRRWSVLHHRF